MGRELTMKISEIGLRANSKRINKVVESRFGLSINYKTLTIDKANSLVEAISSSLKQFSKSHNLHQSQKNPKYMEFYMVKEGLEAWLKENNGVKEALEPAPIVESETAKSEAILASRDIVDSIQDMMEKIGKMQNEQMPALLDAIRDQISSEQADAFKASVEPVLTQLEDSLRSSRETVDGAARTLAGEQVDQPMDMPADDAAAPADDAAAPADDGMEGDVDAGADEFAATDAAAGGTDDAGREERV